MRIINCRQLSRPFNRFLEAAAVAGRQIINYKEKVLQTKDKVWDRKDQSMGIYHEVMKRVNTGSLASYLLYEEGQGMDQEKNLDRRIAKAYETLFAQLKEKFPEVDPDDDDLMDIIINFSKIFEETYFEMGLAAGFEMYRNMDKRILEIKGE